jgi:serine protease AprX
MRVENGSHRIPGTRLYYDDDDVSEGRLSLIVSAPKSESLDRFQKTCRHGHARIVDSLDLVHGIVVDVPVNKAGAFVKSLPRASRAWVDATIDYGEASSRQRQGGPIFTSEDKPEAAVDPSRAGVDRAVTNLEKVWDQGITGKGVNIAVIDSGLYPHPDLKGRIVAFHDMTNDRSEMVDNVGHGTQVAGIAAGDGSRSHGAIKGAAPDAGIVGVRITSVSEAIAGLQWVIANKDRLGIKVVNMSLGDTAVKSFKLDPWAQAAEKAVAAGLVVVVAAGNEGNQPGTISTPGIDPEVITVGAMDTMKTADRGDDVLWHDSSRGPTVPDKIDKPDLVAPGVSVFGPLVPNSRKDDPSLPHLGRDYVALTGSSQATPFVAGVAALMLGANPRLTHDDIKEILAETARKYLPDGRNGQGAGVLDAAAAVEMARGWKGRA